MDNTTTREVQRDAQRTPSQDVVHAAQMETRLKNLHTCLPGIIIQFDPAKQTAQVQPAVQRIFTEKGVVNLPVCVDVPVVFPAGGIFALTFPVAPNDECLLWFSERCIDLWFTYGGVRPPAEYRLHDLSDGIALVGLSSLPRSLAAFQISAAELRNRERTFRITVTDAGDVELVNPSGSIKLLANGNVNIQAPTVAITGDVTVTGTVTATVNVIGGGKSLKTHVHSGVTPGGGNTGQPV